jgi:carboxylesterase
MNFVPDDDVLPTAERPLLPGAEPMSAYDGTEGVLVLHGFTGTPASLRPLAEAFADAGLSVELPLLPGHGSTIEDMLATRWPDWLSHAEEAYQSLSARCDGVVVAGLSMGGTLALALAEVHREIAGLVLVNPLAEQAAPSFYEMMGGALESGVDRLPGIGSDIAREGRIEAGYAETPIAPLMSLMDGVGEVARALAAVTCPVLLLSSRVDHVVPPSSGDVVAAEVSGPVERVFLERSYHVATLDHDQVEVEERSVQFALKVLAA